MRPAPMLLLSFLAICADAGAQEQPLVVSPQVDIGNCLETDPAFVASVTAEAVWGACVTDPDAPVHGIAIYAPIAGVGNWSFRLDESSPWQVAFPFGYPDGVILLGPEGQVSFQTQPQCSGVASISIRAWDGSDGRDPGRHAVVDDPDAEGSSISADAIRADWLVASVNESLPTCTTPPSFSGLCYPGSELTGFAGQWADPLDATWMPISWSGRWEVETIDDGIQTFANTENILVDPSLLGLRIRVFVTATDSDGGVGTAASPWATVTANQAPTLAPGPMLLAQTEEDAVSTTGVDPHADHMASISDADGPNSAFAIIEATGQGRWQVAAPNSIDGPTFTDLSAISAESPYAIGLWTSSVGNATALTAPWTGRSDGMLGISIRLVIPGQLIRFVPDPGWHGTATLTVRAWDGSSRGVIPGNAEGNLSDSTSAMHWVVERTNDTPLCLALPQCLGTPGPGAILTIDQGLWSDDSPGELTVSATWEQLDDSGGVEHSWPYAALSIGRELAGRQLRVRVDALDSDAAQGSAVSTTLMIPADQAPTCTSAPTVSGTCIVGSELGADGGGWTDDYDADSLVLSLAWERLDGATITTIATQPVFTPTTDMAGTWIRLLVTAQDEEGHTSSLATSWLEIAAEPIVPDAPEQSPTSGANDGCAAGAGLALLTLVMAAIGPLHRRRTSHLRR